MDEGKNTEGKKPLEYLPIADSGYLATYLLIASHHTSFSSVETVIQNWLINIYWSC